MTAPKLIINSNWCKLKELLLDKNEITIGRTPDNDIIFTHQSVSRSHAIIVRRNSDYFIKDKHSKHGTYINKEKIQRETKLKNLDVIHLGLVRETEMKVMFDVKISETNPGIQWYRTTFKTERSDFHSRDLQMLLDISQAINSTLILEDVLNLVIDAVLEITKAQYGVLLLFNEEKELEYKVARNFKRENINHDEIKISHTIVSQVASSGEAIISGNVQQEEQFKSQQSVLNLQLKTVMCVPLKIISPQGSNVIGVIYVHNRNITAAFSKKTMDLLEYMALHAAIAIENARFLKETRFKERMKKELEIAYEIQTDLLPQTFPKIEGIDIFARSVPAEEVGGDFYYFIQLGGKKMGLAIGDVIGKSIPAALYMSSTFSILETLLTVNKDLNPKTVIKEINSLICKKTKGSNFVTFLYGIIDLQEMTFTYSNAGHIYPILMREQGIKEIVCNGAALGMFKEDQFETTTVSLKTNDYIILYSDGLVEAIDAERNMFGFKRLFETLLKYEKDNTQKLGNNVFNDIENYFKDVSQFDDMTLVCLNITKKL